MGEYTTGTHLSIDKKAEVLMWVLHMLIFLLRKMSVTPRGQSQRSGNLVSETSYSSIHSTNT